MSCTITWGLSPDAWSKFLAACPFATFFHGPGWHQAIAARHGHTLDPALITFATGETALLPLAVRPRFRGLAREALSGVAGGYGGLLSPVPLSDEQVEQAYALVRRRHAALAVTGNPFAAGPDVPVAGARSEDTTQVVRVRDPEAQRAAMASSRQKALRRAAREPFELTVVEGLSEADVARFFPLYAAHSATWANQRWVHDEAYFRALVRHAGEQLTLFLVHHAGRLAAFRLIARQGSQGVALHVARDKAYEAREVGPYLMAESLAWCHDAQITHLDLMASGSLDGVRAYKASFGAEFFGYSVVTTEDWRGAALGRLSRLVRRPAA